MTNPWDVHRATLFTPCASHCLVDGHPGLLIGRRDGLAWAMWLDGEVLHQEWCEARRVEVVR